MFQRSCVKLSNNSGSGKPADMGTEKKTVLYNTHIELGTSDTQIFIHTYSKTLSGTIASLPIYTDGTGREKKGKTPLEICC